jgi:hypothetical protein
MSMSGERDQAETIARWTDRMYGEHGAVHHVDIVSENTLYRVFFALEHASGRPLVLAV